MGATAQATNDTQSIFGRAGMGGKRTLAQFSLLTSIIDPTRLGRYRSVVGDDVHQFLAAVAADFDALARQIERMIDELAVVEGCGAEMEFLERAKSVAETGASLARRNQPPAQTYLMSARGRKQSQPIGRKA